MKIYKNWSQKFAQAYANQKHKSAKKDLSETRGFLSLSADLPHALLHHTLIALLAIAACALLIQLKIPWYLSLALSCISIIWAVYHSVKVFRYREQLKRLQCSQHHWTLLCADGSRMHLEIQSISQGLGLVYVLGFISQDSSSPIDICIWKYQTKPDFLAYCSQLLNIGISK